MITRLILLASAAASLSACGRRGDLEQPPPLFGDRAKAQYEAEQKAKATAEREEPEGPRQSQRRVDPATANTPATRAPVEGTNDPVGARPNLDPNRPGNTSGGGGPR